jgi:hypothetical protein
VLGVAAFVLLLGCRSTDVEQQAFLPLWDLEHADILEWDADDPAFDQDRALEASGMAAVDGVLYVASEAYGRLLRIDPDRGFSAQVLRLDVPRFSELEGLAVHGRIAYLCDEAHAVVYSVDLDAEDPGGGIPSRPLRLEGIEVRGGKIGLEGVAITPDGALLYLLLERTGDPATGCASRIFPMEVRPDELVATGNNVDVELEDCTWRLTSLELWQGRLLALKTQYPGKRYQLVVIDPVSGDWQMLLDLTELLRSVTGGGWGNNVEGLTITSDGSLYLVGDNAMTLKVDDLEPPPTGELTLLMRIPPKAE